MAVESAGRPRPRGAGPSPLQSLLWRRPWLRAVAAPDCRRWLVRRHLPRVARAAADHRVLDDRPVHDPDRPGVEPRQLPDHPDRPDVPVDHRPHRRHGRAGHRDRCGARLPVRLLHGSRRVAADADPPVRRRAAAAVGELPRPRLLLDPDPQPQRGAELEPAVDRPAAGQHRLHEHRDVDRLLLHLAALHDHPDLRRAWNACPSR